MNNIHITSEEKGEFNVNLREEVYSKLNYNKPFKDWIKQIINKYNWNEGLEFSTKLVPNPAGEGRPLKEYFTTKEKALIVLEDKADNGLEVREKLDRFTISMAEALKNPIKLGEMLIAYGKELQEQENRIKELETENKELDERVELLESADTPYYDMSDVCGEFGFRSATALNKYFVSNGYLKRLNGEYYVTAEYTTQGWFTKRMRFIKDLGYSKSLVGLTPTGRLHFKKHFDYMNNK